MAAVNSRKKLYVLLKGPFTEIGINEYLRYVIFVSICRNFNALYTIICIVRGKKNNYMGNMINAKFTGLIIMNKQRQKISGTFK